MNDAKVRDRLTAKLMDKHDHLKKINIQEFGKMIQQADKDLFFKIRDGQITLTQLKARIMERVTGVRIVVIDDIKASMGDITTETELKKESLTRKDSSQRNMVKSETRLPTSSFKSVFRN